MRWRYLLLLFVPIVTNSGCLLRNTAQYREYRTHEEVREVRERQRYRKWAQTAWARTIQHGQAVDASKDYEEGFIAGFSEYLYSGNDKDPVLPPKHYRNGKYQTAQDGNATNDWFAGFRHGAAAAQQTGFRQLVTGPSSVEGAMSTTGRTFPSQQSFISQNVPRFSLHKDQVRRSPTDKAPFGSVDQDVPYQQGSVQKTGTVKIGANGTPTIPPNTSSDTISDKLESEPADATVRLGRPSGRSNNMANRTEPTSKESRGLLPLCTLGRPISDARKDDLNLGVPAPQPIDAQVPIGAKSQKCDSRNVR
ncbi:MAG: hypothetical protein ACFCD0_27780 [Gemmataceae bacterium]